MSARLPVGTLVIVSVFRAGAETLGTLNCTVTQPLTPRELAAFFLDQLGDIVDALPEMLAPQFPIMVTMHSVAADHVGFDVANVLLHRVTRRTDAIAFLREEFPIFIERFAENALADVEPAAVH